MPAVAERPEERLEGRSEDYAVMTDTEANGGWVRAVLVRATIAGVGLGAIASAGTLLIEAESGGQPFARAVVAATTLVALAVGMWAGAPEAEADVRLAERWLSAGALAALSGSFATFRLLYEPILPGPWFPLGTLLFALALPIYGTGLLLPALYAWAEATREEGEVEGEWGGLGPVALGVLGGAAAGVLVSALTADAAWGPTLLMAATAVLLVIPLALPAPARVEALERDLFSTVSPFSELRVAEVVYPGERQPERRLYLNGEEESSELVRSGAPTLAYIAAAESWLSATTPPGSRFLFLGGGAYTLPRRVAERDRRARIAVVELDPEVTRIAQHYFGLKPAHGITTVHGDARAFLDRSAPAAYDRIYLDVYGGDEKLPHSLLTEEADRAMARALADGGIVAANVIGSVHGEEERQLWSVVQTFASVFPNVALYSHLGPDFPDRQNFLLAGTMDARREFPDRAGHFDRWPADQWPTVAGATIYRDLMPAEAAAPAAAPGPAPRAAAQ